MKKIGYALCGSFCTLARSIDVMRGLVESGYDVLPIMSEKVYTLDTRFGRAEDFIREVETVTGREILHTVPAVEPLGPKNPLDALVIAPCTGNTAAKIAAGITDSAVTMAAKAHLRCDRPLLVALASNDALSQNLSTIATLSLRKSVYLVPMRQDDPKTKPYSLVAAYETIPEALEKLFEGKQMRPLFL